RRLASHDVVAVSLVDRLDEALPALGRVAFRDPETGESAIVDTSDAATQACYADLARARRQRRQKFFRAQGIDEIELRTGESYARPLLSFFRRRGARRLRSRRR
ncbi:MAG: DUF58 domain-containing protein, partial [Cyanobacteria bacterium REEB65]|nr:DUF58 domain-containing protein [Cyanobacteria bacterium REEB65]